MSKRKYFTEEDRLAAKREQRKRWNEKHAHKPHIKARVNAQTKKSKAKKLASMSPEQLAEYKRNESEKGKAFRRANPEKVLIREARKRAKQKNLPIELLPEDIIIPKYCPVLGLELIISDGQRSPNSISLDRIDNAKGYTKDNIAVISLRANTLKNDATIDELKAIIKYMEGHYGIVR